MNYLKKMFLKIISFGGLSLFFTKSVGALSFNDAIGGAFIAATGAGVKKGAPEGYITYIIFSALTLIGMLFLLLMIYGGYIWMIARGDESEAKRAKDILTMAVIGMVVIILAYAISTFVFGKLVVSVSGV